MRKFSLITYDKQNSFDLNSNIVFASEPQGLGNAFEILYKDSDQYKEKTNAKVSFDDISLKLIFNADGSSGYKNYKDLTNFLTLCGKEKFLFNYTDDATNKYCEVLFKSLTKSEISNDGLFGETLTLDRQTYWFEEGKASFLLSNMNDEASKYSLSFPFGFYGKTLPRDVKIENKFFEDMPTIITIEGDIQNKIEISLSKNKTVVSQIKLSTNNENGQTIEINAQTKKITVTDKNGVKNNGYYLTDKTKQSFLYIPPGEYYLNTNMSAYDSGGIIVQIEKFILD